MAEGVPPRGFENRVALRLNVTDPNWSCRECIARTLGFTVSDIKIAFLRLLRFRGRDYIETGYDICDDCGAVTAVVRLARPRRLPRIA
jgi:hypothetical protein